MTHNASSPAKTRIVEQMHAEGRLGAACTERLAAMSREARRNMAEMRASEGLTHDQMKAKALMEQPCGIRSTVRPTIRKAAA